MHNIDITNDIDSNIIINTPITMNDIEFKQFLVLLSLISFIWIFIIHMNIKIRISFKLNNIYITSIKYIKFFKLQNF